MAGLIGKCIGLALFLAVVITAICGWVFNIVAIVGMTGFSGLLVLRIFGIFFAPLGVVLGLFV